jgi:hypothetical protein
MDHEPVRTKPARAAPPAVRRPATKVFIDLARRTQFCDPSLVTHWPRIAGPELAPLSRPGRLTGGGVGRTLEVIAPNGPAANRVQFEAEGLRRRVNDFLGPGVVARIAVRQVAPRQGPKDDGPKPRHPGRFWSRFTDAGDDGR